jgi:hypothetical protein
MPLIVLPDMVRPSLCRIAAVDSLFRPAAAHHLGTAGHRRLVDALHNIVAVLVVAVVAARRQAASGPGPLPSIE